MANAFDQFDSAPAQGGAPAASANAFDQFDSAPAKAAAPSSALGEIGADVLGAAEDVGATVGNALGPMEVNAVDDLLKQASGNPDKTPLVGEFHPGAAAQHFNEGLANTPDLLGGTVGQDLGTDVGAVKGVAGKVANAHPDVAANVAAGARTAGDIVNAAPLAALGEGAVAADEATSAADQAAAARATYAPSKAASAGAGPVTPEELQQKGVGGIGTSATPAPKPRARVVDGKLVPAAQEAPPAPAANPKPLFEPAADENARTELRTPEERQQLANEAHELGMNETRESALNGDRLEAATDFDIAKNKTHPAGQRMSQVIEDERAALRQVPAQLLEENGGAADTTEGTNEAAGKEMAAPVTEYRKQLEAQVQKAYEDVKTQHGDKPLQPTALNKYLTEQNPEFTAKADRGTALRDGVRGWLQQNGLWDAQEGQARPMNVYQAERLRQFVGRAYHPETAQLNYGLKDAIDDDVTRAAGENVYQKARAVRSFIGQHFEEQPSINKLDEGDDRLGIARKVALEDVGKHIENMSGEEFRHYLRLMEAARRTSPELAAHVGRALTQLRSHFLRRIIETGDKTAGMWNSQGVNAYLRANEGKIAQVFRPQEIDRLQKMNRVGNALRMDRTYRGAYASRVIGEGLGAKVLRKSGDAVATVAGAHAGGPVGALLGHGFAKGVEHIAEGNAERAVEKRIVKLANEAKPAPAAPRRLNVPRSQRGGPRMADFQREPAPVHEAGAVGDHKFSLPGSELHAQETDVPGLGSALQVKDSHTAEGQRGQGKGSALYRAAAEYAHGRGMPLVSDNSVSPAAQRRWHGLKADGYTVHMAKSAEPGVAGRVISGDIRRPVYVAHPAAQDGRPLAEKFPGQRGGPKAAKAPSVNAEYQASPELEAFVKSKAPPHRVDEKGPATWEELQAARGEPVLPINPHGAEDSIYSSVPSNIAFRAWHDATHLKLGAGFDAAGELRVALAHQAEAKAAGLSDADRAALWADTWETFKHHEQTGEFPSKPREFVAQQMAKKFPGPKRPPLRQGEDLAADEQARRDADAAQANPNGKRPPLRQGEDPASALYGAQAARDADRAQKTLAEKFPGQRGGPRVQRQAEPRQGGAGAAEGKTLSFRHFSGAEGAPERLTLSPEHFGEGLSGAERRRMANNGGPKVISAYAGDHPDEQVEPELRGKTEYRVTVPESSVYNLSKDPAKIRVAAKALAAEEGIDEHTAAERLLKEHGYSGYHLPGAQGVLRGQARFFKPVEGVRTDVAERDRLAAAVPGSEHLTPEEREGVKRLQEKNLADAFAQVPHTHELAAAALAGEAKRGWYRQAAHSISTVFGADAPRFTALLAAMSPQTSVEMNFHNALRSFVAWDEAGRPQDAKSIVKIMEKNSLRNPKSTSKSNVLHSWQNNAIRALTAKDPEALQLSGPKVDSFMRNLRDNVHAVTLDSWMAKFAGFKQDLLEGTKRNAPQDELRGSLKGKNATYKAYSARVREAAELLTRMTKHPWTPEEVQETVWSWSKAASEHADETDTPIPKLLKQGAIHDDLIKGTSDFHSLFQQPGHAAALRGSSFAGGLEKLHGSESPAGPRTSEEARAAAQTRLAPHLKRAADRLEDARDPVPF